MAALSDATARNPHATEIIPTAELHANSPSAVPYSPCKAERLSAHATLLSSRSADPSVSARASRHQ